MKRDRAREASGAAGNTTPRLDDLTARDMTARVRVSLWGLVDGRPDRMAILREATARALDQIQDEARRRGMIGSDEGRMHHAA